MKLSVTQENLARALNHILKATAIKPNIPVLANVLITGERGQIRFSATNLDISISAWIGGDVAEDGELTVNARLLTEFVSQLKSNRVELIQTKQILEVKSVDNQAQLFIIPAEDFPTLPTADNDPDIVINAYNFRQAILRTSVAAAVDQSRPILTGLLLESTEKNASLVGVDGFRLAKQMLKLQKGPKDDVKVVIPAKSLLELAKIVADISDDKDEIGIYLLKDKNQVLFKLNEVVLSTRILDGEFPDYRQIIPSEQNVSFSVDKSDFIDSVKISSIFARNVIGNKAFFSIHAEEKKLKLSVKVTDVGNNESQSPLKKVSGEDYETAYNAKFLADMLAVMQGEEVLFESNGITAPGVFKDSSDTDYLHIIMPMRIE